MSADTQQWTSQARAKELPPSVNPRVGKKKGSEAVAPSVTEGGEPPEGKKVDAGEQVPEEREVQPVVESGGSPAKDQAEGGEDEGAEPQ